MDDDKNDDDKLCYIISLKQVNDKDDDYDKYYYYDFLRATL